MEKTKIIYCEILEILGTATNGMKITHNSLLKSGLLNSLPCMIDSPNRIQRTRRFHTVFFSVPSVPFVVPWCSTRDSRLASKPIIDAAQDSRKLLRFQRLSLTSCHSGLFLFFIFILLNLCCEKNGDLKGGAANGQINKI